MKSVKFYDGLHSLPDFAYWIFDVDITKDSKDNK